MKRILFFLLAAFVLTLLVNIFLSVRTAVAPEAPSLVRKGDSRTMVHTPDGQSLFGFQSEKPLRIRDAPPFPKIVALTFDDGPHKRYTTPVLDILREKGVTATFFLVGDQVQNAPLIAEDIARRGHQIGNHSFSHIAYTTEEDVRRDREVTDEVIRNATEVIPRVFRPPYGVITPAMLSGSGLPNILWSVDSMDWQKRDSENIAQTVLAAMHPGAIVLLHDTHQSTVDALPLIIDRLREQGYEFVTIDTLFGFSDDTLWRQGIGQHFSYATHRPASSF